MFKFFEKFSRKIKDYLNENPEVRDKVMFVIFIIAVIIMLICTFSADYPSYDELTYEQQQHYDMIHSIW